MTLWDIGFAMMSDGSKHVAPSEVASQPLLALRTIRRIYSKLKVYQRWMGVIMARRRSGWWRLLLAAVVVVAATAFAAPREALAVTRDEAVDWAMDREGEYLDYDGAYGAQCVDLIKYYYEIFGVEEYATGNGSAYASNALPPGWERIQNTPDFVPEPGDVAVWGTALSSAGHLAIILDADLHSFVSMDQNWPKGSPCTQVDHTYNKFWGVVRPAFEEPPTPTTHP